MDEKLKSLKTVLCKNQESRDSSDIKLLTSFLSNVKFFESLKDNKLVFKECCMYLSYEHFPKNTFIFKEGEFGEKFYILIKGEAKILVTQTKNNFPIQKEVLSLNDGAFFGELALTSNKPRAASILTKAECHCAVMDKFNYNRILSLLLSTKQNDIIDFLKKQSYFQHLTKVSLLKLSYCFEEKYFLKDFLLFREGEKLDFIYLIKEGEIKLSRKIKIEMIGSSDPVTKGTLFLKKSCWKNADIEILESGSLIGINDIESGVYSSSCKVHSKKSKVLKVSINDFTKRMNNEETLNEINKGKEAREFLQRNGVNSAKKVFMDRVSSPYKRIFASENLNESKKNIGQVRLTRKEAGKRRTSLSIDPNTCIFNTFDSTFDRKIPGVGERTFKRASLDLRKTGMSAEARRIKRKTESVGEGLEDFLIKGKEKKISTRYMIKKMSPFGRKKKYSQCKEEEIVNIHISSKKNLNIRPNTPKNWSFINMDNSARRPFSIQPKARNHLN